MIFLYTFLCLILFILLFIPGFVSNKYLSQKKLFQVPDLFLGFILFILIGTIFSIFFIKFIPLQYLWISSYLLLLISSTTHFFISKDTFFDILSISMIRNILIFCIVFLLTLTIRFFNPDIINTEKIMELMILTSVMDMKSIIPDDLWFHNENIKYYYFGYFVFSSVPKMLLLDSSVAYNFILPTVISYSAVVLIHFTQLLFEQLKIKKNFILFFIFSFIFITWFLFVIMQEFIFKKSYIDLAKRISNSFRHIGNLDCDAIKDNRGNLYWIDFNPRFGGGYPFTHLSGYNFLKAIIDSKLKKKNKPPQKTKINSSSQGYRCLCV
mgnify:CR=1 FL=1